MYKTYLNSLKVSALSLVAAAAIGCDGGTIQITVTPASQSSERSVSSAEESSSSTVQSSSSALSMALQSSASFYESESSTSSVFSDDTPDSNIFDLGVQSIDGQGLAIAISNSPNPALLYYGPIHGTAIISLGLDTPWDYSGDQRLFDLYLSPNDRFLVATFEFEVKVFDTHNGTLYNSVATQNGPAKDVLIDDGHLYVVTEQQGKYLVTEYAFGHGQLYASSPVTFDYPVDLEAGSNVMWVRQQTDINHAVLTQCKKRLTTCFDDVIYTLDEFEGKFSISPDDNWILTQANNLLSTSQSVAPSSLYWDVGRKGFIDMHIAESGQVVVIDNAGYIQNYDSIGIDVVPTTLDPDRYFHGFYFSELLALESRALAAVAKRDDGSFVLVALTLPAEPAIPYTSSSSAHWPSSQPYTSTSSFSSHSYAAVSTPTSSAHSYTSSSSSSSFAGQPTNSFAHAPSIEWVEKAGWVVTSDTEYKKPNQTIYVAPSALGSNATANPRANQVFTNVTLHVSAFDREKRYKIGFAIRPASEENVDIEAKLVDAVLIADENPALSSLYATTYPLLAQTVGASSDVLSEWTLLDSEFDFWGSSGLTLNILSSNNAPFYLDALFIEEVGPSTIGSGMIRF